MLGALLRALVEKPARSCLPSCRLRLKISFAVDRKNEPENAPRRSNGFTTLEETVMRAAARVDAGRILADQICRCRQAIEIVGLQRGSLVGSSQPGICGRPFRCSNAFLPSSSASSSIAPSARLSEFSLEGLNPTFSVVAELAGQVAVEDQ
jgi:hypothetical protein